MNSKLSLNYFYNLMYQFLAIALPILTVPYVSRTLGASALGEYYYITAVVSYFNIFAILGTTDYGQREIAKRQDNKEARSKLFWDILYLRIICTFITLIIYIVFIFLFPSKYYLLLIINLLSFISWIFDVSWYFQGMENFKVTAIRNGLVKILATILIFILIKRPSDVVLYTFIYVIAGLIGNLTMIPYLKDEITFKKFKTVDVFSHVRGILSLFLPVVAIQLYTVLNRVILGALSTSTQVSYFSQIMTIINLSLSIMSAFVGVLTPHIANIYGKGLNQEIRKLSKLAINFVYLLGLPMMLGCLVCGDLFVPIFFGYQYKPAIPILYILSILFIVLGFGQVLGGFLISTDRQRNYTVAVSFAAVPNLILDFIFLIVFHTGAIGVSIATIVSETISTSVQIYYLRDLLGLSDFVKGFLRYGLISTIAILPISLLILLTGLSSVLKLIFIITIAVIIYFIILNLLKDKAFNYMLGPIIKKVYKGYKGNE
ncbi:flippase [Limosilactobacillus fermentum]|uniref:flippase n=1 Tax=Limosilactobacillus fermentum TaxID=1613 RepID=UPI001E2FFAAE|nr:flippase [Limosilactobacillus fermentum]MCC6111740.1 flippase [Limosilactobacillus fermentum]